MITSAGQLKAEHDARPAAVGRADYVAFAVAILSVIAFGSLNLFLPFTGDTALFSMGAQAIDRGEILYVDFWDNKQPGIYWFFLIAGWLFGFDESGVRMLELVWWLAFVVISVPLLRPYFHAKWLGCIALAIPVCTYFAAASPWVATQVEALVAGPILISGLLLLPRGNGKTGSSYRDFVAGVFAAITVTFKLAFAPLFVVIVLFASIGVARDEPLAPRIGAVLRKWAAFTLGVTAVLSIVCCVFVAIGGLDQMLWASFVYPGEAISNSKPAPYDRLMQTGLRLFVVLIPWSPALLLAFWRETQAAARAVRRNQLTQFIWIWLIVGAGILLIQRFSWWSYHATVLIYPACILAVCGIDVASSRARIADSVNRTRLTTIVVLLMAPGILAAVYHVRKKAPHFIKVLKQDGDQRWRYQTDSEEYAHAIEIADAFEQLQPQSGKIYVFGNPLIYQFTNRTQALPIHGWAWEFFLDEQWAALPDQLKQHRPPYIFCTPSYLSLVREKSPATYELLQTDYAEAAQATTGVWYAHRSLDQNKPLSSVGF